MLLAATSVGEPSVDWGSVPEWLAAVGTVGALIVALVLLGAQIKDRRVAAEIADRAPADGIFAWTKPSTDAGGGWQTWVLNASSEPIFDAVVRFQHLTQEPEPIESVWGTIPPGPPVAGDTFPPHADEWFGIPPVEIEFTDGRSRNWLRDFTGTLQQIPVRAPFD